MMDVIRQARKFASRPAIPTQEATFTYGQVLDHAGHIAARLLNKRRDLAEARVAMMISPGMDYVAALWGIWQAGGVAVPLCITHPLPSLRYVLEDTRAEVVLCSANLAPALRPLADSLHLELIIVENVPVATANLPEVEASRRALILYTSGTTNLPKGVVTTHHNISSQISTLVNAWHWSASDHILCVLPLHHVHGIINVVGCALWAGAQCTFADFEPKDVLNILGEGKVNVFMAVPTIYFKLITAYEALPASRKQALTDQLTKFRLMVSGSAALPVSVMEKWFALSGHKLLERYGMTELGMAISNPYHGERRPGSVGQPLPGVSVRLMDDTGNETTTGPGEIQVKGANVFKEYWNRQEETASAFTSDGWFRTGDVAVVEEGYYRILGRNSVDIIKSGGYKISALEIEEVLRQHPSIGDCAVVGIENEEWGEIVAAAVVMKRAEPLDAAALSSWMKQQIPAYRVPRTFLAVNDLPRNAMGKVTKGEVKKLFAK